VQVIVDGLGMNDQDIDKAMTPFWRGQGSQHVEGAGLGLSIASNVVSKMGGKIQILASQKPPGTQVIIALPLHGIQ
jgi:signal transduction histidine kinase